MTVEDKITVGTAFFIKLPKFSPIDGEASTDNMNLFYDRLAEEIISYTCNSNGTVRRYRTDYTVNESKDGETSVTVLLYARIKYRGNPPESHSKYLYQIWRNGVLKSHTSADT